MNKKYSKKRIVLALVMGILMATATFSFGNDASEVCVRTAQYNVFCVPANTDNLVWDFSCSNDNPFSVVNIDYEVLPDALSEEDFANLKAIAESCLGVEYKMASQSPSVGFDCSGLVYYVCRRAGRDVEWASCEGILSNCVIVDEAHLCPGDLVFFSGTQNRDGVSHVGIYIGDGKMIHASMSRGVEVYSVFGDYWGDHFECYARPLSYSNFCMDN